MQEGRARNISSDFSRAGRVLPGICPWGFGGEAVVSSEYEDWNDYEGTTAYAGPVLTYQGGRFSKEGSGWWATLTPLFQLTDEEEAPDLNFRLIVGINF